jgi:hypothetical protein
MKMSAAIFMLCTVGACAIHPARATAQSTQTTIKHFRLTFVLSYPQGQQPSQSFVLDVPVMRDRSGMSGMSMAAGSTGEVVGSVQENLQCTDVQESATGLAAKVAFTMDSVLEPLPNSTEPLHRQLTFNRQIDVALGKETRITNEMHVMPLGKADKASPNAPPAAPQISVTAIEL